MRAACLQESLVIRDVADPTPGPGEVVIAVKGCGICGSDLHVTELGSALPAAFEALRKPSTECQVLVEPQAARTDR